MSIGNIIEKTQRQIAKESILSDEFIDFMQQNKLPYDTMIAYYRLNEAGNLS